MRVASVLLTLVVSLVAAGNLFADDQQPKKEGKHGRRPVMSETDVVPAWMLKTLTLTDEQKTKLDALKKEYEPKLKDALKKRDEVLTADQKKAREEAFNAARTAGKRGPEVRKDVDAAMKLTDEQKGKLKDAQKEMMGLRKEIHGKVFAVLTPEQQETLKKARDFKKDHKS